ncbi:MAG: hypothetical protein H6555_13310, partial [Lewinellaceae bacterium]|nr:hypothetical protein [Lewinellaceae bacterium]
MQISRPYLLNARLLLVSLLAAFSLFTCKRQSGDLHTLTEVNPFVYGYTSGVISRTQPIKVRFAQEVVAADAVGETLKKNPLTFSPAITGLAIWEDERTLRFDPQEPLPSATTYEATLQVSQVISEAKKENASFRFAFRTREQFFQVDIAGLQATDLKNPAKQELRGTLYAADVADPAAVEKVLAVTQGGQALAVNWEHSADQLVHTFVIPAVNRGKGDSEVAVNWTGKPLGVSINESRKVKVTALGKFLVTDVRTQSGDEQYFVVRFSDPLKQDQNLDGLITLKDFPGTFRYLIEDNTVRVYPGQVLSGSYTLNVNQGIRNSQDKRLDSPASWDLTIESAKPQVKLVGNGVILPNSNGLHFPFEAVGLKAVDVEVFKIYHNNVLQFLQDNNLDGDYELYKVGRIVMQRTVELQQLSPGANSSKLSRYALDLSKLIAADEEAIYQVRIGFRPEYASLGCQLGKTTSVLATDEDPYFVDDQGKQRSIMDHWYGANGWSDEYDWERRDDPCAGEYYNSERFTQRNVLSSNLGLIAKSGSDGKVWVVVTDLRTTAPIGGATLAVYDYQQQLIGEGTSNGDGIATIDIRDAEPFVVVASQGKQKGYLRILDGDALNISRFDVSGATAQGGLKGMLFGERGVWRPGDSVYLNFIVDDRTKKLPESYPITLEIYNARGQLHERRVSARQVGGIYPLAFATKADDPTGNWRAKVKAGGAVFEKVLKIETVKPNRLKIDLDFGAPMLSSANEPQRGQLHADWLHGAPGSGLKAVVEAQLQEAPTRFAKYSSFVFTDPARSLVASEPRTIFEGSLDQAGNAKINANLLNNNQVSGMLNTVFRTRVFEPGGDFSTDNQVIPYSPFKAYAGVEVPKNKYGEPRIEVGQDGVLRVVVVDEQGKPLAGRRISLGLYRVQWRWWWDEGTDYVANYNTTTHLNAQLRQDLVTNDRGEATWKVKPDQWGRYLVRVCDTDGGHCSGSYLYAGYPWYGEDGDASQREVAAMLSFQTDKEQYRVGETATLTIPTGKAGRALVSLENGSGVLQTFWTEAKDGENKIAIKLTEAMAPTVYAHVTLIQPHAQVQNDLPIRLYGIIPIQVENANTKLEPVVSLPTELRPEQTVTVQVSEKGGKAMAYTLALVDEGLLGLTRYKTPNPHDQFYAREALGVHTWDIYDKVLGAYGAELERILTVGGDAIDPGALNNTANRFEPVVIHLGPFALKKGGKATHQIKIPNYVGALRVMVVAAQDGAYGAAEKSVPVRNPLMVLATAPRVLTPGDQFDLPVNIFVS